MPSQELPLQLETVAYVNTVVQNLPASTHQLERIRQHQEEDEVCQQVAAYCQSGWPSKQAMTGAVRLYDPVATELSVEKGLLMRGSRSVLPAALRLEMLDKLHTGHQGITKCRERARHARFAHKFQFEHTTSPHYPQSNGEAERAVRTVKSLLKKEGDPYLALMSYRATPLQNGFSPSELLMSRRLRTTVP